MRIRPHIFTFLLVALFGTAGCVDPLYPGQAPVTGPASLSLSIGLPTAQTGTKANGYWDGDETNLTSWGQWERLVDGQELYRITLFIINHEDCLVGYRDFYLDGTVHDYSDDAHGKNGFCEATAGYNLLGNDTQFAAAARASFQYDYPLHGTAGSAVEQLVTGNYQLLAVANYSPINNVPSIPETGSTTTKDYSGLNEDGYFTAAVNAVITAFNNNTGTGVVSFKKNSTNTNETLRNNIDKIFMYQIRTVRDDNGTASYTEGTEQFICEQRPQPLSLVYDFSLHSGNNTIACQLVRTYSRIRFVVTNETRVTDLNLQIDRFLLSSPFAQRNTSLFDFGDDSQFNNDPVMGIPVLDSDFAIKKYDPSGIIAPSTGSAAYNNAVLYDAYILESRRPTDHYHFSIQTFYNNEITTHQPVLESPSPVRTIAQFNEARSRGINLFLVRQFDSKVFMFDNGSTNYTLPETANTIPTLSDSNKPPVSHANLNTVFGNSIELTKPAGEELIDYSAYIWRFIDAGVINGYYIRNFRDLPGTTPKARYLGSMPGKNDKANRWIPMVDNIEDAKKYFLQDGDNLNIHGDSNDTGQDGNSNSKKYLNYNNNNTTPYLKWFMTHNDKNGRFLLYPVTINDMHNMTLQYVNPDSGIPEDITEIRRNQFLTVNISVSYHTDGGYLVYVVNPWTHKGGSVTFE